MKLKPGKYVQRDGGIATVAAVDENRKGCHCAIGWDARGEVSGWYPDGLSVGGDVWPCDLVREYREPREFWLWRNGIYCVPPITNGRDHEIVRVREVLP